MWRALRTARAGGGLWYHLGGYWLPWPPTSHRQPTAGELEGGWFDVGTLKALRARGLITISGSYRDSKAMLTPVGIERILASVNHTEHET
jgi:hypothetical protein